MTFGIDLCIICLQYNKGGLVFKMYDLRVLVLMGIVEIVIFYIVLSVNVMLTIYSLTRIGV